MAGSRPSPCSGSASSDPRPSPFWASSTFLGGPGTADSSDAQADGLQKDACLGGSCTRHAARVFARCRSASTLRLIRQTAQLPRAERVRPGSASDMAALSERPSQKSRSHGLVGVRDESRMAELLDHHLSLTQAPRPVRSTGPPGKAPSQIQAGGFPAPGSSRESNPRHTLACAQVRVMRGLGRGKRADAARVPKFGAPG